MLKTIFVLPDGTELSSGVGTANAIGHITYTQWVNDDQELCVGSACANMLEATLITPGGGLNITAGDELTVYRQTAEGTRHKLGIFLAEKPTRPSANTMRLTAFDRMILLDKDLSGWLAELTDWPYRADAFAEMVCGACGLPLKAQTLANGAYKIRKFTAEAITGRMLIRWLGQIAGCFARITAEGELEFAWYSPNETLSIGPDGGENRLYCYQNGLSFEDYQVAPIQKVRIRQTREDLGCVYPADLAESVNTYFLTGNRLLATANAAALEPVASHLYERLSAVCYTPCKVTLPANWDIHAGDIVSVTDRNGKVLTMYVMKKTQTGQRETLECTGSPRRDSSRAVNNQSFAALSGKMLTLQMDVEGLQVENRENGDRSAKLELDVSAIQTQVQRQQAEFSETHTQLTQIRQDAEAVALAVTDLRQNGVSRVETTTGYTFGPEGLRIQKSGEEMENRLDNTGMYVTRSSEAILQANSAGVVATDVTVRNYLILGAHARLEDYAGQRTACFYI